MSHNAIVFVASLSYRFLYLVVDTLLVNLSLHIRYI